MSAIDDVFARCAEEERAAFIPFLMAGDPDLEATAALLEAVAAGGADIIELGVPFSDPIADGPVNQRAAVRALAAGTKLSDILELVARHRDRLGVPIVLFTYFNPLHARGVERFAEQAAASGVDGVLCVDLPPEEGERELRAGPARAGARLRSSCSRRPAPATGSSGWREISTGFVYYVSRTGVTGEQRGAAARPGPGRQAAAQAGSTCRSRSASASRRRPRWRRWGRWPTAWWWAARWCGWSRSGRATPACRRCWRTGCASCRAPLRRRAERKRA